MSAGVDDPRTGAARAFGIAAPVAGWAVYAPISLKYLALLSLTALSIAVVGQRPQGWRSLLWSAGFVLPAALLMWLVTTAWWTPADWTLVLSHGWSYSLLLCAVVVAAACPTPAAFRALAQFVWASGLVGALWVLHGLGALPASGLLQSTVAADGNQRIAASVLMALAVAFAAWLACRREAGTAMRIGLATAALLALAGLVSQDRRTGMALLPLLLLAWALAAPRALWQRLVCVTAVAALAIGAYVASDNVRARFAEGRSELQAYRSQGPVQTSWGQRLRMIEITAEMVREKPLVGHGIGSWLPLWQARTTPGTLLWINTTPHNEYLLVATQGGVFAAMLLFAWITLLMLRALRAGSMGRPALMLWLTLAVTAMANASIRDTKLAVPLLVLAGVTGALCRGARPVDKDGFLRLATPMK